MTTDLDATVRATAWDLLRCRRHGDGRKMDDAEVIAQDIARYARSCNPPGLEAPSVLRRLTVADVLAELAEHDLGRRRRAAYRLAWDWGMAKPVSRSPLLEDAVDRLLSAEPARLSSGRPPASFGLDSTSGGQQNWFSPVDVVVEEPGGRAFHGGPGEGGTGLVPERTPAWTTRSARSRRRCS
jgi:hypothetical protein